MEDEYDPRFIQRMMQPSLTTLVGRSRRPGMVSFCAYMEYNWFLPGSASNTLLAIESMTWEGVLWIVISVPSDKLFMITAVANTLRLRLVQGAPTAIGGAPQPGSRLPLGVKFFPGSFGANGRANPRIMMVQSAGNNPLHDPEVPLNIGLVMRRERQVVSSFEQGARPSPDALYKFIYGFDRRPGWLVEAT